MSDDVPAGCPSPEEITLRAWLIRIEWTPAERMKRLRVDWRPTPVAHVSHRAAVAVSEPLRDVDR